MFDAAREGNATLLLAAIDAGLPPNLTNEKGTSHTSPDIASLFFFSLSTVRTHFDTPHFTIKK